MTLNHQPPVQRSEFLGERGAHGQFGGRDLLRRRTGGVPHQRVESLQHRVDVHVGRDLGLWGRRDRPEVCRTRLQVEHDRGEERMAWGYFEPRVGAHYEKLAIGDAHLEGQLRLRLVGSNDVQDGFERLVHAFAAPDRSGQLVLHVQTKAVIEDRAAVIGPARHRAGVGKPRHARRPQPGQATDDRPPQAHVKQVRGVHVPSG